MSQSECGAMRLGIGSYSYAWAVGVPGHLPPHPLSALDLLEKAGRLDVRVVQICDNLPLHELSEPELDELRESARRMRIQIEVGTRGIAPQHLRRYIELAARFDSPLLRVVIDTAAHRPSLDEAVDLLSPLRRDLEQADICLAIENHDRFSAQQFRELVTRLDCGHVGICLDTVNSFGALEGPGTVVATLSPWIVNVHIKDFVIRRAHHEMGFVIEGCPAGQGRLDVPWLLRQLAVASRTANAILEQWPSPEPTLEATIAKEDRWAGESVMYLRSLIHD